VTIEIADSLSAFERARVESVWQTPNARHQAKKPGLSSPAAQHAGDEGERQEKGEAAPDVDVLVERVPQALHDRVAEHLKQRRRQGQGEPHADDSIPGDRRDRCVPRAR